MHIPDGYLGPVTSGALYAVMIPVWIAASNIVKKTLKTAQVPLLAMGAAFSFVIMMFNIPIPGGTTGHAAGAALAAIILGPWAACVAITTALVIQALLFGDGGITAMGANCFNMAFIMPFTAYFIYRFISRKPAPGSKVRIIAAAIAGYASLNIAAFFTAVEFGLQPMLHHAANGQALYCPYGLRPALIAMMSEHLLIFGWIEAFVTAAAVKYLQRHEEIPFYLGEV